jgi:hypothetical protein
MVHVSDISIPANGSDPAAVGFVFSNHPFGVTHSHMMRQ